MGKGAGRAFLQAGKLQGTCRGLGRIAQITGLLIPESQEDLEGSCYSKQTLEAEGVTHWHCLGWLCCLPEVCREGGAQRGGAQGGLCHTALPGSHWIPCPGQSCGWVGCTWLGQETPKGHVPPRHPLAGGPGMAQCWHVPPCSRDTCRVVVGGKSSPRGSFPTTPTGQPGPQAQGCPGLELWLDAWSGSFPGGSGLPCGSGSRGCSLAQGCPCGMLWRNEAGVGSAAGTQHLLAGTLALPALGLGDVTLGTGHKPPCPCRSMCQAGVSTLATVCHHGVTGDGLLPGLK